MIRDTVTAWPLYWPTGWPRSTAHGSAYNFRPTTLFHQVQAVLDELRRLGVSEEDIVVSTNLRTRPDGIPYSKQPKADDPGVAVWFSLDGVERVLACDRWSKVEHNMRAIALHIGAIRGQERWGVGSAAQAFAGFVALPEEAGGDPWHVTLRVTPNATVDEIESAYRRLAMKCHPDHGGKREDWDHLQAVKKIALQARGRGAGGKL